MEDHGAGSGVIRERGRKTDKRQWSLGEDKLLTALVKTYGPGKWNRIAGHVRGRSALSCRSRWVNHLNPQVDKTPFSEEEKERLLKLHRACGNKWSALVSFFPGRTDSQLKNQYHVLVGSRVSKVASPSSSRGGRGLQGRPNARSMESSHALRLSTPAVVTQISDGPGQGKKFNGNAPRSNSMPEKTKMPLSNGGSSSIHGGDVTHFLEPVSNLSRNGYHSSGSMKFAAISGHCAPVAQPQGVNVKNQEFIDFLGVEKPE